MFRRIIAFVFDIMTLTCCRVVPNEERDGGLCRGSCTMTTMALIAPIYAQAVLNNEMRYAYRNGSGNGVRALSIDVQDWPMLIPGMLCFAHAHERARLRRLVMGGANDDDTIVHASCSDLTTTCACGPCAYTQELSLLNSLRSEAPSVPAATVSSASRVMLSPPAPVDAPAGPSPTFIKFWNSSDGTNTPKEK